MNRETPQTGTRTQQFTVQLSATRRGARLARLLATEQLRSWGLPLETAAHVIAELAANAALHGRVPGRDFRLMLTVYDDTLRIEVTDARAERLPVLAEHPECPECPECPERPADSESGRGLLLVGALADRWGVTPGPVPCKTVWAEITLVTASFAASHLPRPGGARRG
ncbi:ATP-binding protein [Streptomyces sp. NPDC048595]|uniref:ATP-binding protein n=1 Tax=Streptomyces sp. NPDC048595 TaxID=3365576 RepID=UPI003714B388